MDLWGRPCEPPMGAGSCELVSPPGAGIAAGVPTFGITVLAMIGRHQRPQRNYE